MKKIVIYTIVVILVCVGSSHSTYFTYAQFKEARTDSGVALNVRTNKTTYLELEPIAIQLEIKNTSAEPKMIVSPNFFNLQVEVTESNGSLSRFGTSLITVNRVGFPTKVAPGEAIRHQTILATNLARMFSSPGDFEIRFILPPTSSESAEIVSEPIHIRIEKPTGLDAQALGQLKRHQSDSNAPDELFRWTGKNGTKDPESELTDFVLKHSGTVYGEYAILRLALILSAKRDYEKAQIELRKLERTTNEVVRNETNILLTEIAKQRMK